MATFAVRVVLAVTEEGRATAAAIVVVRVTTLMTIAVVVAVATSMSMVSLEAAADMVIAEARMTTMAMMLVVAGSRWTRPGQQEQNDPICHPPTVR